MFPVEDGHAQLLPRKTRVFWALQGQPNSALIAGSWQRNIVERESNIWPRHNGGLLENGPEKEQRLQTTSAADTPAYFHTELTRKWSNCGEFASHYCCHERLVQSHNTNQKVPWENSHLLVSLAKLEKKMSRNTRDNERKI